LISSRNRRLRWVLPLRKPLHLHRRLLRQARLPTAQEFVLELLRRHRWLPRNLMLAQGPDGMPRLPRPPQGDQAKLRLLPCLHLCKENQAHLKNLQLRRGRGSMLLRSMRAPASLRAQTPHLEPHLRPHPYPHRRRRRRDHPRRPSSRKRLGISIMSLHLSLGSA
jgi:hypothetical protein